jgi:hypothetical protein
MVILRYLLGVVFFCGVFVLGKLIIDHDRSWAMSLKSLFHRSAPSEGLCNFFHYCGRIFQVVAVVWGFLDAVAILVLIPDWFADLLMGQ